MKNKSSILEYIISALPDLRISFVFPSEAPAQFWAKETAQVSLEPISPARFIAWDTFKSQSLSIKYAGKTAVNRAIRTFFSSNLLRENMQKQFLTDFINPVYASSYTSFISSLSKLLPTLDGILKLSEEQEDNYFKDLRIIHQRYVDFLFKHSLYEPSWERADFSSTSISEENFENKYMFFFPELCEDWEEYKNELEAHKFITIVSLDNVAIPNSQNQSEKIKAILSKYERKTIHFSSAQEEYRWLALIVKQLLDEGRLSFEDIVISLSQNADLERLIQTFKLYDIPTNLRQGRSLTEYPGGRIFTSLSACSSAKWSFQSLKNLLLDKAFPWKDTDLITALMEFGIKYRCKSGYTEKWREVDVWEKTFDRHIKRDFAGIPVYKISNFYSGLKNDILSLVQSVHFSELARQWQEFETRYFDRNAINPEVDKIIARSMKALEELALIEERFSENTDTKKPRRLFGRVFPVFLSYLQEQKYVYQASKQGITIYDYKVAATLCPMVHFIISMNQEGAAVVYKGGASFLREDRKSFLGFQDRDVSKEFIKAYSFSAFFPVFTLSTKTFSGPAIPHRLLSEILGEEIKGENISFPTDPYKIEDAVSERKTISNSVSPTEIQKQAWQRLKILQKAPFDNDLRKTPINDSKLKLVLEERLGRQSFFRKKIENVKIHRENDDDQAPKTEEDKMFRIAPTDLNEYKSCSFKWVLERALFIREKQTEIETIDQRDMGKLYHRILERLFTRIKREEGGGRFRSQFLPIYKEYIKEETVGALQEERSKEGAFQEYVYAMLENRIVAALSDYLDEDIEILNGAEILGAEYHLRKDFNPDAPCLSGIADLVLEHEDGGLILTDFKTGTMPTKKELLAIEKDAPEDLQIASYIAMIEDYNDVDKEVKTARFYSIDKRKFRRVVSEKKEQERYIIPRTSYQKEVDAVETVFSEVVRAMNEGKYEITENRKNCWNCSVSSICRNTYIGGSH